MLLGEFAKQCEAAGLSRERQEELGTGDQYHFDERKPLAASINTDAHYFRVAQYLRLCRRSISLAGMSLISVTPGSRLNEYFPYESVEQVCQRESKNIGYPPEPSVKGFYTGTAGREPGGVGPMRDYRPHHWKTDAPAKKELKPEDQPVPDREHLKVYLENLPAVEIREEG